MRNIDIDVFATHVAPLLDSVAKHFLFRSLPDAPLFVKRALAVSWPHKLLDEAIAQHYPLTMIQWFHTHVTLVGSRHLNSSYMHNHQEALTWIEPLVHPSTRIAAACATGGHWAAMQRYYHKTTHQSYHSSVLIQAVEQNRLDMLQWLHTQVPEWEYNTMLLFRSAVKHADLSVMQWLEDHGTPFCDSSALEMAIDQQSLEKALWLLERNNHMSILARLKLHQPHNEAFRIELFRLLSLVPTTAGTAANEQSLSELLSEVLSDWQTNHNNAIIMALDNQSAIHVLKQIRQNDAGAIEQYRMLASMVSHDRLDLLPWYHGHGFALTTEALCISFQSSKLEIFRWLVDRMCPFPKRTCLFNIGLCHRPLVDQVVNHPPQNFAELAPILAASSLHFSRLLHERKWIQKIDHETIQHFQWAGEIREDYEWFIANGAVPNRWMLSNAVRSNDASFFQWASSLVPFKSNELAYGPLWGGALKMLQCLHQQGHGLPPDAIEEALAYGNKEMIEWVKQHQQ